LGVGLLEFHQLDQMVRAGRAAARALLEEAGEDLASPAPASRATPVITMDDMSSAGR
jgi:hypothetical protein